MCRSHSFCQFQAIVVQINCDNRRGRRKSCTLDHIQTYTSCSKTCLRITKLPFCRPLSIPFPPSPLLSRVSSLRLPPSLSSPAHPPLCSRSLRPPLVSLVLVPLVTVPPLSLFSFLTYFF